MHQFSYPRRFLSFAALLLLGLLPLHAAPQSPHFVTQNSADEFTILGGTVDTSAANVNVQVNGSTVKGAGFGSANVGATTFTPASPNITDTGPGTFVTVPSNGQPFVDLNDVYSDLNDVAPGAPFQDITTGGSTELSMVNPAGLGNGVFPPGFYYVGGDATIAAGATIQFVTDPVNGPGDIVFFILGALAAGTPGTGANANAIAPEAPPNVLFVLQDGATLYDNTVFDGKLNADSASLFDGVHVRGKVEAVGAVTFTSPVGGTGIQLTDWGSPPVGPDTPVAVPGLESAGIINSQQQTRNSSPIALMTNSAGAYILCPGDVLAWQVDALDPDSSLPVSISVNGGPADFTSIATGGAVTPPALMESYTPQVGDEGNTYTVTYTALKSTTGAVSTESISFFIDTPPAFIAPTPSDGSTVDVCPNMTNDISLAASDGNSMDTVTLSLASLTAEDGGALPTNSFSQTSGNPANGTFEIIPGFGDQGRSFDVTVAATNQNGCAVSETFTVRVDNLPIFSGSTPANGAVLNVPVGQPLQFDVEATDADGTPMHLEVTGTPIVSSAPPTPAGLPFGAVQVPNELGINTVGTYGIDSLIGDFIPPQSPVSSRFEWTPTAEDVGLYELDYYTYSVACPTDYVETSVDIWVSSQPAFTYGPGATPANGSTIVVCPGQTAAYTVTATSRDPLPFGELTISSSSSPTIPSGIYTETPPLPETAANSVSTNVSFTPTLAQAGQSYTVTYSVTNFLGLVSTSTVTLLVDAPPVITLTPSQTVYNVCAGQTVSFSVQATGTAPGPVELTATGVPAGAAFPNASGNPVISTFTWTPGPSAPASSTVTFTATDSAGCPNTAGGTSPTTVTINVSQLPTFVSPPTPPAGSTLVVVAGQTLSWEVKATSNNTGQTVALTDSGTNPPGTTSTGTASGAATADVTYTFSPPSTAVAQVYPVTYTASLSGSQSCPQTWSFNIRVSSLPTVGVTNPSPAFSSDQTIDICAGQTASFTVTASDANPGGSVTLSETGAPSGGSFVPTLPDSAKYPGSVQTVFTYTAPAGGTTASSSTITFTATNADDGISTTTVTLNVHPLPVLKIVNVAGIQMTGGNGTQASPYVVCAGNQFSFEAEASDPDPTQGVTLTSSGALPPNSSLTPPTFPGVPGQQPFAFFVFRTTASQGNQTFSVTLTVTDHSPVPCVTKQTVYIRVSALPSITFLDANPAFTSTDSGPNTIMICDGSTATFRVMVQDVNTDGSVTLSQSGAPTGATFTPDLPFTAASPATGESVFSYTSPAGSPSSTTNITFTAVNQDGCTVQQTVTLVVMHTVPTNLTLTGPETATVNQYICYVATVTDDCPPPMGPRPVANEPVTFTLSGTAGTNPSEGTSTTINTGANGQAQFCVTVLTPGTIVVTANAAGIETVATTNTTVPVPTNAETVSLSGTGLVDATVNGGNLQTGGAQFNVNVSANANHVAKGSLNFVIPVSSVKAHSTSLTALTVNSVHGGEHATLFGTLVITGKGVNETVAFRADFWDMGSPGVPNDKFTLQLFSQGTADDVTNPVVGSNLRLARGEGAENGIKIRVGKATP